MTPRRSCLREVERSRIADGELTLPIPLARPLRSGLRDHRRGQVDAVHRADPAASLREITAGPQATSSQRASVPPGPARSAHPASVPTRHRGRSGERLRLVGELLADRVLVHRRPMSCPRPSPHGCFVQALRRQPASPAARSRPEPRRRLSAVFRRPARPPTIRARSAMHGSGRRPIVRARPISESVPHSPPTAITASPEATTARLRAWPMPVATTWVQNRFASLELVPGDDPDRRAPRLASRPAQAASITPPRPPQTTRHARLGQAAARPPRPAAPLRPCSTPAGPMTATCRAS